MTVLGIDISKWNGNWNAVKAKDTGGAVFVFVKASQATYTDPLFITNWEKAKSAGLLRGAYHYMDYAKPAKDQANYFATLLEPDPGELPAVVDFEHHRSDKNIEATRSFLQEFIDQLEIRNLRPMIYTSHNFWSYYGDASEGWLKYPLWLANYNTIENPPVPLPWKEWTFWQYSSNGPGGSYGSESLRVDLNYFNGTLADLHRFASNAAPADPQNRLPNYEERLETLEHMLSSLEPVFTETYANLEKRVTTLEEQQITGESSGSSILDAFDQRLRNLEQEGPTTHLPDLNRLNIFEERLEKNEQKISDFEETLNSMDQLSIPAEDNNFAVCNVRGLNVRKGPGMNYPIVNGLTYGQRVKVIGRQNGWVQLESPTGWSAEKYLTMP